MSLELKRQVKPSDFNVRSGFMGSSLGKSEKEQIASNVVVISLRNNDAWFDFTFEDYKRLCAPRIYFGGEEEVLDQLVEEDEVLNKNGDTYSVNERFFRTLANFIK